MESELEEKKLKWTDLKSGNIIRCNEIFYIITSIDTKNDTDIRVHFGGRWRCDFELEYWEKVE